MIYSTRNANIDEFHANGNEACGGRTGCLDNPGLVRPGGVAVAPAIRESLRHRAPLPLQNERALR